MMTEKKGSFRLITSADFNAKTQRRKGAGKNYSLRLCVFATLG